MRKKFDLAFSADSKYALFQVYDTISKRSAVK